MTLFRNSADDLPFMTWLFDRIMPMEDRLRPGDCYWTTLLGICEMLRSGTTTFLDMFMMPDDAARAVADSGMRAVLSRGLQGQTANDEGGMRRLREAKQDILAYSGAAEGRITFMLAPHAPYTCAPAYLETVIETAADLGVGIHTHLAESRSEIETIREQYGCTPVELMEKVGLFKRHTAAAHCVQLTPGDIRILRDNGVSVLTNPSSNLKLGNGFAPVPELLAAGVNVALGTDSAASNNTLNMFHEINMLALIHKGTHADAVTVTSTEAVTAATLGGAKALDLPVGALAVGKKADIVLLDLGCPQLNPPTNLISSLAFSANGSEVDTVIVNGKILMEKRKLTTIDEERVIFESNRIFERVKA
jgi:5-methylthioadenosine/S-adenosylhomocysteine deaminase